MADEGIFATTAEVQYKAGANASGTSNVELYINSYMTQAESLINVRTEYNWSDAYSGLNADVKGILKEVASDIAAIYVINYDPDAIGVNTAAFMVNILNNNINRGLSILKEHAKKTFTQNA